MSHRYDAPLITGAHLFGDGGLGIIGSLIPSAGESGAGYAYNDLSLPTDNAKEICGRITTWPSPGTLTAYEDTSFDFTATDGAHSFQYQLYVDGVATGSPETVLLYIGSVPATLAANLGTASATGNTATIFANETIACAIGTALATGYSATVTSTAQLTDSEKIDLILDILSNKQTLDPVSHTYTLFADDGVTVLKTALAWEDAAGTIPYKGMALQRLDPME